MITEDYVSFETAKLLKEKGFDIPCDNYYGSSGKTPNESVYGGINIEPLDYNADPYVKSGFPKFKTFSSPTQSIAMKWLREVHLVRSILVIKSNKFIASLANCICYTFSAIVIKFIAETELWIAITVQALTNFIGCWLAMLFCETVLKRQKNESN